MMKPEEQLEMELYRRFREGDDDAFGALYLRFWPPQDHDGVHLVEWAMWKYDVMVYDAEDAVAGWLHDMFIHKPEIHTSIRAVAYKSIRRRILEFWRKHNPQKNKPYRPRTNEFRCPGEEAKAAVWRAEGTASVLDGYNRAKRRAHFLDLAVLQAAMTRLSPEDQETIRGLDDEALDEAGEDITSSPLSYRENRALDLLCAQIFRIKCKETRTRADQERLLAQWGEMRPDVHWVPTDETLECDCPECKAIARRKASARGGSAPLRRLPAPRVTILVTDEYGYKLRGIGQLAGPACDAALHPFERQYVVEVPRGKQPGTLLEMLARPARRTAGVSA